MSMDQGPDPLGNCPVQAPPKRTKTAKRIWQNFYIFPINFKWSDMQETFLVDCAPSYLDMLNGGQFRPLFSSSSSSSPFPSLANISLTCFIYSTLEYVFPLEYKSVDVPPCLLLPVPDFPGDSLSCNAHLQSPTLLNLLSNNLQNATSYYVS